MVAVSKIIIRLFAGFLALIFATVTILGIILVVSAPYYSNLGIGVIVFGGIGLLVAFTGCCGAGFEKNDSEQSSVKIKGFFLVLFFAVMLILDIALIIFGVGCLCLRSTVFVILGATDPDKLDLKGLNLGDNLQEAVDLVEKILLGIGIAVIVLSAIILLVVVVAAYRMGVSLFSKFFITTASIIEIIIGLALSIFLLFEKSKLNNLYNFQFPQGIFIIIVIFGFVLAAIGFLGFWNVCAGSKLKCVSAIFNAIIFSAFVTIFVILIVFRAVIGNAVHTYCKEGGAEICETSNQNMKENYCKDKSNDCVEEFVDALTEIVDGWITLLMISCMVLVAFLTLVVISTCVNCFRKSSDEDKRGKYNQFPDYSYY